MNNKLTKGHLQILRENYEKACCEYINTLLNLWELSPDDGWWVGNMVGSTYVHEASIELNMDDIIFCIENNISLDTYYKYIDYIEKCIEYHFKLLSLKAYCEGAPQVPKETFDKLDAMKKELEDCIDETKNMF